MLMSSIGSTVVVIIVDVVWFLLGFVVFVSLVVVSSGMRVVFLGIVGYMSCKSADDGHKYEAGSLFVV